MKSNINTCSLSELNKQNVNLKVNLKEQNCKIVNKPIAKLLKYRILFSTNIYFYDFIIEIILY